MCSVQEDGDVMPEQRVDVGRNKKCMKCDEAAVVVIRAGDPMCRSCFISYCTHKFRSAFGKSRVVRDGELAIVAFSGGNSSSAMLHLIQEGKSPRAHRKLRFQPSVVYIDEGGSLGWSAPERDQCTQGVVAVVEKTGLPLYVCALEQALNESFMSSEAGLKPTCGFRRVDYDDLSSHMEHLHLMNQETKQLTDLLAGAKTLTSKESLVHMLRRRLLVAIARKTGHSKVLVGDSSTRLAINMLSDITQGRGAHVALEMSFADCRYGEVMIVRPMREFIAKEVVMYNSLNGVITHSLPSLVTKKPSNASLSRLTEEFVAGLQADHPRTVPTVFRTGEKLAIVNIDGSTIDRCTLCQAPVDTDVGESSALSATRFSQTLSSTKKSENKTGTTQDAIATKTSCSRTAGSDEGSCCGEGDGSCQSIKTSVSREDVEKTLCYGCLLVLRDMTDISALPASVFTEAASTSRRRQMKETIQDFLLEDGGS